MTLMDCLLADSAWHDDDDDTLPLLVGHYSNQGYDATRLPYDAINVAPEPKGGKWALPEITGKLSRKRAPQNISIFGSSLSPWF